MTDLQKALARIAELEAAQARNTKALRIGISEKGCICVYGLNGQFPVSLYKDQWIRLLDSHESIRKVIKDNETKLDLLGEASRIAKQQAKATNASGMKFIG